MKWEMVKLSECCSSIADGDHQSMPLSDSGIPFIVIADIRANSVDLSNSRFVPNSYYEALDVRRKPQKGDVLYTVKGSFGIPAYVNTNNPFTFQRDIAILKCNERVNSRFLYYVLKSDKYYKIADSLAIGSAQRALTLKTLNNLTIPCPPLETQYRIASILSAYDDLIENNQKQIKLLEEAAQRLYKEWFVDLRFPGHEHTAIVDGVPEGWSRNRADYFFDITIGKTPPRAEKQWFTSDDKGIPWLSISDMGNSNTYIFETSESLTSEAINKHTVKVVPQGSIFVSFKLTVGRVAIAAKDMCTNEAIAHFYINNAIHREYVYCYLKSFEYDTLGSTSSISKAVNSKIIKAMPFIMPDDNLICDFHNISNSIFENIKNKQLSCMKLKEARDRLLPKLMSGEMEV